MACNICVNSCGCIIRKCNPSPCICPRPPMPTPILGSFVSTVAQSVATGSAVSFPTTLSNYNITTDNQNFTINTTGLYKINYGLNSSQADECATVQLYLNDAPLAGTDLTVCPDSQSASNSVTVFITAEVTLRLQVTSGTLALEEGSTNAYMNIQKVG